MHFILFYYSFLYVSVVKIDKKQLLNIFYLNI